jgi:predicted acylesterase/phospholipase RssA
MSNHFMKLFVQQWGINANEIWKYFDVICGTSIGGILSLAYSYGLSPDENAAFFTNDGPWIFTIRTAADVATGSNNASLPSNRPDSTQKVIMLGQNDTFYNSVDPVLSNYGSTRMQTKLVSTFGTDTLQELKTNVIIPTFDQSTKTFQLMSNLDKPGFIGQDFKIVDVARATSAAPLYLPSYQNKIDGGTYLNNPANLGLTLGKMNKKTANRFVVLSVGTGIGEYGFEDDPSPNLKAKTSFPYEDTVKSLVQLLDIALTGPQEAVARDLYLRSNFTMENLFYYRFQPQLDANVNTELDNTDSTFLTYLTTTAETVFSNDNEKISTFIGHLTA